VGARAVSGGWRLRVVHTTRVGYASPVRTSFNEARMTPLTLPTQMTLESRVIVGGGTQVWTYNDYWGTYVSAFDLPEPHSDLTISARSTVETEPPPALPVPLAWDAVESAAGSGRLAEFLLPTTLTSLDAPVSRTGDPHETAGAISASVREQVRYVTGATGVRTSAQQAWDQGEGVCQDMAHVTVALLRRAGLPARYVSGYLHADPSAAPGQTIAGQSHAWVEYWAGDWVPCDPTSGAPVGERHVVVARGRDYDDVPPLKGIFQGPAAGTLSVSVEVTRLA